MKQVKKLLVILPLVALFVLGSLPVLATRDDDAKRPIKLTIMFFDKDGQPDTFVSNKLETLAKDKEALKSIDWEASSLDAPAEIEKLAQIFEAAVKGKIGSYADQYEIFKKTYQQLAADAYDQMSTASSDITETVNLKKKSETTTNPSEPTNPTDPTKPDEKPAATTERKLTVRYIDANEANNHEATRVYTLPAKLFENLGETQYERITTLAKNIKKFVMDQLQDGYEEDGEMLTFANAAERFLTEPTAQDVTVLLSRDTNDYRWRVVAFDIHNGSYVFDRLYKLTMRPGFNDLKDVSEAFYNNTKTLQDDYLYVGFATRNVQPVLLFRAAYLERFAEEDYMDVLNNYNAHLVVFVVPKQITVTVKHIFPEGTRAPLNEVVPVEYEKWASLQNSSRFMDLPSIFQTRIQKVNEMGFAYNRVEYFNGYNPITGLLQSYDWFNHRLGGEGDDNCIAKVFYDKAVATAKEEKKVDAATAPQAQIKAPAVQAQAPVAAANVATTTAPTNTLPVTGASDSIFLFLSSAALMAVGILFFKKH